MLGERLNTRAVRAHPQLPRAALPASAPHPAKTRAARGRYIRTMPFPLNFTL